VDSADELELDQYVVVRVRDQEYGIQALGVQEISLVAPVTEVPGAPPYLLGIMNLRGQLVSVIDFRRKFGLEPGAHDEDTRIVLVDHGGFPVGVVVDEVVEVLRIPDPSVQALPEGTAGAASQSHALGVAVLDERLITLLNIDRVLESVPGDSEGIAGNRTAVPPASDARGPAEG